MAKLSYPAKKDFITFVSAIKDSNYSIKKYLPPITTKWYTLISECVDYVRDTSIYEEDLTAHDVMARILYKVAKRHELGDGNKRSAVISVYLFCLVNDYFVVDPKQLKKQAKRVASTKGRTNENIMKKRIANSFKETIHQL